VERSGTAACSLTKIRPGVQSIELRRPDDIAEAVAYIVTHDDRVAVNEILIRAGALGLLNASFQSTLPSWVKARGIAFYPASFQGAAGTARSPSTWLPRRPRATTR